jgi:hypothetical protein
MTFNKDVSWNKAVSSIVPAETFASSDVSGMAVR